MRRRDSGEEQPPSKPKKRFVDEVEDSKEVWTEKTNELIELIRSSKTTLVYTGAGISTSANIPDYRGQDGLYNQLEDKGAIIDKTFDITKAQPTPTHLIIKEMVRQNIVAHVLSQNCDGLHLRSGMAQNKLSEIHGNMFLEVCLNCKPQQMAFRNFDTTTNSQFGYHTTSRKCERCKKFLSDTIVHSGEIGAAKFPLNWDGIISYMEKVDLIIILGSSCTVLKNYSQIWPTRAKIVIVNLQKTAIDSKCAIVIRAKTDEVMLRIAEVLNVPMHRMFYCGSCDPVLKPTKTQRSTDDLLPFNDCNCHRRTSSRHRQRISEEVKEDVEKEKTTSSGPPGWLVNGMIRMQSHYFIGDGTGEDIASYSPSSSSDSDDDWKLNKNDGNKKKKSKKGRKNKTGKTKMAKDKSVSSINAKEKRPYLSRIFNGVKMLAKQSLKAAVEVAPKRKVGRPRKERKEPSPPVDVMSSVKLPIVRLSSSTSPCLPELVPTPSPSQESNKVEQKSMSPLSPHQCSSISIEPLFGQEEDCEAMDIDQNIESVKKQNGIGNTDLIIVRGDVEAGGKATVGNTIDFSPKVSHPNLISEAVAMTEKMALSQENVQIYSIFDGSHMPGGSSTGASNATNQRNSLPAHATRTVAAFPQGRQQMQQFPGTPSQPIPGRFPTATPQPFYFPQTAQPGLSTPVPSLLTRNLPPVNPQMPLLNNQMPHVPPQLPYPSFPSSASMAPLPTPERNSVLMGLISSTSANSMQPPLGFGPIPNFPLLNHSQFQATANLPQPTVMQSTSSINNNGGYQLLQPGPFFPTIPANAQNVQQPRNATNLPSLNVQQNVPPGFSANPTLPQSQIATPPALYGEPSDIIDPRTLDIFDTVDNPILQLHYSLAPERNSPALRDLSPEPEDAQIDTEPSSAGGSNQTATNSSESSMPIPNQTSAVFKHYKQNTVQDTEGTSTQNTDEQMTQDSASELQIVKQKAFEERRTVQNAVTVPSTNCILKQLVAEEEPRQAVKRSIDRVHQEESVLLVHQQVVHDGDVLVERNQEVAHSTQNIAPAQSEPANEIHQLLAGANEADSVSDVIKRQQRVVREAKKKPIRKIARPLRRTNYSQQAIGIPQDTAATVVVEQPQPEVRYSVEWLVDYIRNFEEGCNMVLLRDEEYTRVAQSFADKGNIPLKALRTATDQIRKKNMSHAKQPRHN